QSGLVSSAHGRSGAKIFDFQDELISLSFQANDDHETSGMVCDIGECILNNAKKMSLHFLRQASNIGASFKVHVDAASLLEVQGVLAQTGNKTKLIQDRRMQ